MEKIKTDVLILGAGWSGLVAADLLSKKNKEIVILEKEPEVGGLARTFDFNGFKFDLGGHGLFFKKNENINYLKTLTDHNELLLLKRKSKVLFNNKYLDYPPNLFSVFKINKKYIINIFFDMLRLRKECQQHTFEEWARSNYGDCLYSIYFKDYSEKVWGRFCNELSSGWADKRIGSSNLSKLMKGIFIGNGCYKDNSHFFYFPNQGISSLSNLLEQRVQNKSCRIYKNIELKQITIDRPNSISFVSDGLTYSVTFKHIISSIPIVELIKILPHHLNSAIQDEAREIKYRNLILVSFIINKELITNWHWCYFPSKDVSFSRIHEPKLWSKDMAPDRNTLLCMEIFCNKEDLYWNLGDEELVEKVQSQLKSTRVLNDKDAILNSSVKKIEYAYPLHYRGFEKSLSKIKDFLGAFHNLYLIGRNGTHSYFNMEDCLENVKTTVDLLS